MGFWCRISFCSAGEVKVLDYQTQQYRLFPALARVFAIAFTGLYIRKMYHTVIEDIKAGDVRKSLPNICKFSF